MSTVTVLGASGFIGSYLCKHMSKSGTPYLALSRDDPEIFRKNLGHVIYCIGLTADFRERPFDTVKAHVCSLLNILENARFESFLYLSSTRVYMGADGTDEDTPLRVNPLNVGDLYNISKIMGESLCLASNQSGVRIARLSNVVGEDYNSKNFLNSVVKDSITKGRVVLETTMDSEKDYISIDDVTHLLALISMRGKKKVYNIASGINLTNLTLSERLQELTGCDVEVTVEAKTVIFPEISVESIYTDFGFRAKPVLEMLDSLLTKYKLRLRR